MKNVVWLSNSESNSDASNSDSSISDRDSISDREVLPAHHCGKRGAR